MQLRQSCCNVKAVSAQCNMWITLNCWRTAASNHVRHTYTPQGHIYECQKPAPEPHQRLNRTWLIAASQRSFKPLVQTNNPGAANTKTHAVDQQRFKPFRSFGLCAAIQIQCMWSLSNNGQNHATGYRFLMQRPSMTLAPHNATTNMCIKAHAAPQQGAAVNAADELHTVITDHQTHMVNSCTSEATQQGESCVHNHSRNTSHAFYSCSRYNRHRNSNQRGLVVCVKIVWVAGPEIFTKPRRHNTHHKAKDFHNNRPEQNTAQPKHNNIPTCSACFH